MSGDTTMKISVFVHPAAMMTPKPALATAAPAYPPINAWEELVGKPKHQVMRSQTIAPTRPEKITASVTAWMSIGLPWGVSKIMREHVESGAVPLEEWSHLALGLRFRAAAMGVPFLPTLTMLGSDLMEIAGTKTMTCPYTGETLALVPALYPDVAILHVHRADRFGNCQVDGYPHMDADIARAAATVLVTTEEVVPEDDLRRLPDRTVIPGFVVDALVPAPFGAYPHECYGLYEADFDHFGEYVAAIVARGSRAVVEYLDRYVHGPASFTDYLDLWGGERLARQARLARELVS